MENKLGRKNILEWSETVQKVTGEMYEQAFYEGYDAAKDETPDVEEMAKLLADRYTDEELSEMLLILDSVLAPSRVKSANQQRAELIQRAREFVKNEIEIVKDEYCSTKEKIAINHRALVLSIEYVINPKKRTVVCLLRGASSNLVRFKGIAKCMPGDVFNADIGKAIALARALEIDVPKEFLQAVQPDEKVVGMKVKTVRSLTKTIVNSDDYRVFSAMCVVGSQDSMESSIIDDTNAQY